VPGGPAFHFRPAEVAALSHRNTIPRFRWIRVAADSHQFIQTLPRAREIFRRQAVVTSFDNAFTAFNQLLVKRVVLDGGSHVMQEPQQA
jgi:hypothetical protein